MTLRNYRLAIGPMFLMKVIQLSPQPVCFMETRTILQRASWGPAIPMDSLLRQPPIFLISMARMRAKMVALLVIQCFMVMPRRASFLVVRMMFTMMWRIGQSSLITILTVRVNLHMTIMDGSMSLRLILVCCHILNQNKLIMHRVRNTLHMAKSVVLNSRMVLFQRTTLEKKLEINPAPVPMTWLNVPAA